MASKVLVLYSSTADKYKSYADTYAGLIEGQAVNGKNAVEVTTQRFDTFKAEDLQKYSAIVTALPPSMPKDRTIKDTSKLTSGVYENSPAVDQLLSAVRENVAKGVPYIRFVSGTKVNIPDDMQQWIDEVGDKRVPRIAAVGSDKFRGNDHQGLADAGLEGVNEVLAAIGVEHKNGKPDHNVGKPKSAGTLAGAAVNQQGL